MTCAACGAPLSGTPDPIGGLMVCPSCLRTVNAHNGTLATAEQTLQLSSEQLTALREARKVARKARRA